jgi:hypothetical protein
VAHSRPIHARALGRIARAYNFFPSQTFGLALERGDFSFCCTPLELLKNENQTPSSKIPPSSTVGAVRDAQEPKIGITPYADVLFSELPWENIAQITEIFKRIGVAGWLEQNPFSSLEFSRVVVNEGEEVGGWYDYAKKSAAIALTKAQDEYGKECVWGRISKLSAAATTPEEAVQRTLVHELGHHIHKKLGEVDPEQFLGTHITPRSNSGSRYGMVNPREYFAETLVAYVFHRTELYVDDQLGYGMMARALKRFGLEVAEL